MGMFNTDANAAKNQAAAKNPKRDSTAAKYGDPYAAKKAETDAAAAKAQKATSEYNQAKMASAENEAHQKEAAQEISSRKDEISALEDKNESLVEMKAANDAKLKELEGDTSTAAQAERDAIAAQNATIDVEKAANDASIKSKQDNLDGWEKVQEDLEAEEKVLDEDLSNKESAKSDANNELDNAIDAEKDTLSDMAEKYPDSVGQDPDAASVTGDEIEVELTPEEKAKKEAEDKKAREAEAKAKAEKLKQDKADAQFAIDEIEKALATTTNPAEAAALQASLDAQQKVLDKLNGATDPAMNAITADLFGGLLGIKDNKPASYLFWDAKDGGPGMTGKLEDIIASYIQPKQKHAFMGQFPGGLTNLDWMIKSIDRPKIDVESVEQIRNNVKRNYPVKYNFGDLSITFWDDVYHKTITTIHNYFTKDVWLHPVHKSAGAMQLRDATVIPEFHVYDLVTDTQQQNILKYTFYNAVLSSYDFDANDADDEGTHVIQCVFKIEGYNVTVGSAPRTLNPTNAPIWL